MKVSSIFSQWVISLVVAVTLLGAPVLPTTASVPADTAPHAMHADHGNAGKVVNADDQSAAGCAQHDQCSGKCCATCAQCFTAAFNFSIASIQTYSVQFPIVLHLDDRLTVAVHNRPPTA